ncbi:MAG: thiamine pyrophosphate-dependent dehydrogenase E1 component subunit alpha [Ilumatobacteraceae bacterium]
MYRTMLLIRTFEERIIQLRVEGHIHGVIHPYIGEEAVATGVCAALATDDKIVSTHRGHGHCIAKGARLDRMMAELFGRVDGYCLGKGGSMHIAAFDVGMLGANGIVGGGLPIACGSALGAQLDGADIVTVGFFGDGATGEGSFHESLNISALWKLPVVWVAENNGFASDTPIEGSIPVPDIGSFGAAYGIPTLIVDGNDVCAVRRAAVEAAARARAGGGPTLIEAKTFRRRMHAMRDVIPADARPADVLEQWDARDPLALAGAELLRRGVNASNLASIARDVNAVVAEAVEFAHASPYPPVESALEGMYA